MSAFTHSAPPTAESSRSSVSSETEIGDRIFDALPTVPFKFGPGVYQIIGLSTGNALEHSSSSDDQVIRSACHDGDSQKWELIRLGTGYIIRCIESGLYLDHGNEIRNEAKITMSDCPAVWSVRYDENCGIATFFCPKKNHFLDMNNNRRKILLWEGPSTPNRGNFYSNQWFKLNWLGPPSINTDITENVVHENYRDTPLGSTWLMTTTTTTVTRTTTTKTIKRVN